MADILETILEKKKESLAKAKGERSLSALEEMAKEVPLKSFFRQVSRKDQINLITEIKKKSPSAGSIRDPYDVSAIAQAYEKGGASALSVLTEENFFEGSLQHLQTARSSVQLPLLRKDFIFDPYQVVEAKAFGADAVLLIAEMLSSSQLKELADTCSEVKIDSLVEVFSSDSLPQALNSGSRLIGINTRNLRTLEMVPGNVLNLSRLIPQDRCVIAESGIKTTEDVEKLKSLRVSAALIGESLLKKNDLEAAVRELHQAAQR